MGKGLEQTFPNEDIQLANGWMKKCSASLVIRATQTKTTMGYRFTPTRMAKWFFTKACVQPKRESLYTTMKTQLSQKKKKDMKGPYMHISKWKKPTWKRLHKACESICMTF